ncbi:MAG: VCBS repeat-containing protein [Acidimicrobiia bacterium]|jgi:hypothetical protein
MRSRSTSVVVSLLILSTLAVPLPTRASVDTFIDDDTSRFEPFVETAHSQGLIFGCNPPENDRVCPHDPVTGGTMVLMLARAVGLTPQSVDQFVTSDGTLGGLALNALRGAGVPLDCDSDGSCLDRPISRAEMAALFAKAFRWDERVDGSRYVDIDGSPFQDQIATLAAHGGLLPCDSPLDTRLCPEAHVERAEAVFAIVSVMGLDPEVSRRSPEPEPLGFSDSFDSLTLWDGRTPSSRNRVSLTSAGYEGSGLRVDIPEGSHFGADFHLHLKDTPVAQSDRLYFRYYLKLDADWSTSTSGKLPGFSGVYGSTGKGGYPSSPMTPGWSARLMFSPARDDDTRVRLGYYVYHLGQETRYGDGVGWNEAGRLEPGEWYCLEGQVAMNTPGIADGSLQAWVDGTPALDISGLEFRRPEEPDISIESFWFDVYYGGKQVPARDLGLTFDEVAVDTHRVGCAGGSGMERSTEGDFTGNGVADTVMWKTCPLGTCLVVETRSRDGSTTTRELPDPAWFSLESHRLGMASGDVDGDGEDEVVYRGRCDDSRRCWRVHTDVLDRRAPIENWGDGGRFSTDTKTPLLADWDGDGRDDLAYQGVCGSDQHPCWRVQASTGSTFATPSDWGPTPHRGVVAIPADVDGDQREDLLYQAECDTGTCWFAQVSTGTAFAQPLEMGHVTEAEASHLQLIDFDGNGTTDLVTWASARSTSRIEVRFAGASGLSAPVLLAELDRQVDDVLLVRAETSSPIRAVVTADCQDGDVCRELLYAASERELANRDRYRDVTHRRLGLPPIT